MEKQIGIDKARIDILSEYIRDSWNHFFYEYKVCQNYIRFTAEEKSNYFGDLLNYFDDVTTHLSTFNEKDNYHSALYDAVAILQFMFVQQDLIDEMLNIFELSKSSSESKTKVRLLRNELVGHPISRDRNNNLVSSVFITAETKGTSLKYLIYHRDKNFSFDTKSYNWSDIFDWHGEYVKEWLSIVIDVVKKKLNAFKKVLEKLLKVIEKIPLHKLVKWVGQVYERFHKDFSRLYNGENILYCYENRGVHARYQFAVDSYLLDLKESVVETIKSIDEMLSQSFCPKENQVNSPIHIEESIFDFTSEYSVPQNENLNRDIQYEFGKLYERHPVFGVDYFLRTYKDDSEVKEELQNMASKGEEDVEYYCSHEFLKKLFLERRLLTP